MSFIKNEILKLKTCFIFDKNKRRKVRNELYEKILSNEKLIMTLLVKDEKDIIKEQILFHKAMGVDGFIVTDNNSTDGTLEILEEFQKQGIVLEIIKEPTVEYFQKQWVDRMIKLAKNKYNATWIINSDADEFWYTASLNLKRTIQNIACADKNVLFCYLRDSIPILEKDDFLSSTYFKNRALTSYELEELGIQDSTYQWANNVAKVIHKAKGYKKIAQGNHYVEMNKNCERITPEIVIYHYAIRNYKHFEEKTIKGGISHEQHPDKNYGSHWRIWYDLYKEGKLYDKYQSLYRQELENELITLGAIYQDSAIINFLKHKKIR